MGEIETTEIVARVLGPPRYDRHGNHEVPIIDGNGQIADLRAWSKHHENSEWRIGSKYRIEAVKRHPPEADKARYETSANTHISRMGLREEPEVSLLHVSDTHIGRPETDKEHMGAGNQLDRFLDAINLAVKYRVDAVLHTGDIFDDDVSEETVATVEKHVGLLADADIPIYYVRGHHGCDRGDAFLQSQTQAGRMVHLSDQPYLLGNDELALYGMDADAQSAGLQRVAPAADAPRDAYRMLAWHEAIEPLARNGVPVQRAVDASDVEFDAIALGDLHRSKREYLGNVRQACGRSLRLFYAGATTTIARNTTSYEPAVWLLQVTDGALERHPLPLQL